MKNLDLLSVGSWTIFDYVLRAEHYPAQGETVILDMPSQILRTRFFGDCSANLAASASALGAKTGLGMVVGDDFNKYGYRAHLLELGVDLSGVDVRIGQDSGYSYNITDRNGREMCFSHLGVAADQEDWPPPVRQIENARAVAVSEKFGSYTLKTIQLARELGKTTIINGMVGTANESAIDFLKSADHLFISQKEFEALVELLDISGVRDLFDFGLSMVVVTQAASGSRWYLKQSDFTCDSVPPVRVCDTTGAGDAFAGAAIAMMLAGSTVKEAAEIAASTASFVVEKWGCQTNLVGLEQIQERKNSFFGEPD